MEKTLKTFAILVTLASLPLAANADTAAPNPSAPMTGTPGMGGMMGMMGGGAMKMDGMQMDGMMIQMMQMMMMMEMMQMTRMMADCQNMMADMPMMRRGPDPMMSAPAAPTPKG